MGNLYSKVIWKNGKRLNARGTGYEMEEIKPTQEEFEIFLNSPECRKTFEKFAEQLRNRIPNATDKCHYQYPDGKYCQIYRASHINIKHRFVDDFIKQKL